MNNADNPIYPTYGASGTLLTGNNENEGYIKAVRPFIGLTKREHFAGLAMQGLCAGISGEVAGSDGGENLAKLALSIADNLLKQLEDDK